MKLGTAGFAAQVGTSQRAVENWERGDNRPHPKFLKRMAELAPELSGEIDRELRAYAWHPGRGRAARGGAQIDEAQALRVSELAKERGIDFSEMLRKVVSAGIKQLASPSSSTRPRQSARKQRAS